MTRRSTKSAKGAQSSDSRLRPPSLDLQATSRIKDLLIQREVWGLVITAIGAVTVIAMVARGQGKLSDAWALSLRQLFGIGAYPIAILMLASGIVLLIWEMVEQRLNPRWQAVVGAVLSFFCLLGMIHIAMPGAPTELAVAGRGGGFTGWCLWQLLVPVLGRIGGFLFLTGVLFGALYMALGIPWEVISWHTRSVWAKISAHARDWIARMQAGRSGEEEYRDEESELEIATVQEVGSTSSELPRSERARTAKLGRRRESSTASGRPKARPSGLPPLDLLVPDESESSDDSDARHRAELIEDTLKAFGIPARVVEWHRGPAVTQFGIEPGYIERQDRDGITHRYKIRVNKILSLANDLALALAAAPIRIEAPVPGRSVVGIEVPNSTKSMVGLRGVLESDQFRKMHAPLRLALGKDVSGEPVIANLAGMPHLLLAGATGSGKSVCLNAIIASLLFNNTPEQLKLLMVDPKRVELTNYNSVPHLIGPVVVEVPKVIAALRWVTREMDRRYAEFSALGVRNLSAYNRRAQARGPEPLPMIVVIIDELADLMLAAPDDVEQTLCRIAQMARATGIHLVIATQRPSVDVVTGLIKANFPARISFAVTSQIDSRVILDVPGAEKLLGRGDMLYMAPDSPKLQRIQGCFVSDRELEALVRFWRDTARTNAEEPEEIEDGEEALGAEAVAPWDGMSLDDDDSEDSFLEQAKELVLQHNQASASFLQRQMRIGYPRAARLIDQLEERGIVGPPEAGGRSRSVIADAEQPREVASASDEGV